MSNLLRQLPQVQTLMETRHIAALLGQYSRDEIIGAIRAELSQLRMSISEGARDDLPVFESTAFAECLAQRVEADRQANLRPVINATGIIIHTNLGRAPLAPEAIAAMQAVAVGSSNLEYDLAAGRRGSRYAHVEDAICDLTGAEAALVVNNCAGAVLLSLMATAQGKKVIASRGELIEIGGSYRLPDVIEQSGATLKEVGATNKTRVSDYAHAIDADTAVLLKSHTSNFRIVGFTAAPARENLAQLAAETKTILMEDLGSGVLVDLSAYGLNDEPIVSDIIKAGVDLVMFSGDKLLGGPQCGIIAGRSDIIRMLSKHPLCRAMRIDKLSLAALEATLRLYRPPYDPFDHIPVLRMLAEPVERVKARAEALAAVLIKSGVSHVSTGLSNAFAGGGALPQQELGSYAVFVVPSSMSVDALSAKLRTCAYPVIGRIDRDQLVLDARTLVDEDLPHILSAFGLALSL